MAEKKKVKKKTTPKKVEESKKPVAEKKPVMAKKEAMDHGCDWKCSLNVENQIRVIIGSIIVLCVLLGYMMSETFFFITGLIGLGFALSGAFDFCLLRGWLENCSWNKEHNKKDKK